MAARSYSVLAPPIPTDRVLERVDGMAFVAEGFAWLAFIFPVLWLIFHRMWLVLLAFLVLTVALGAVPALFGLDDAIGAWAAVALSLLFAFQANDLRRWTLERGGFSIVGAVAGPNREACERRFFTDWLTEHRADETL